MGQLIGPDGNLAMEKLLGLVHGVTAIACHGVNGEAVSHVSGDKEDKFNLGDLPEGRQVFRHAWALATCSTDLLNTGCYNMHHVIGSLLQLLHGRGRDRKRYNTRKDRVIRCKGFSGPFSAMTYAGSLGR